MGFLDKAAKKAQELADMTQSKIDDVTSKRKADGLLEDLGRVVYGERTGRPVPGGEAKAAEVVAALRALEAEGVQVLEHVAPPSPPAGSTPPPPPPPGGFAPPPPPPPVG
jgi:hypothetical protein